MLALNKIYCGDCLEVMQDIDDNSVDLTVTSPPYDNLRTYEGYTFDFEGIAHELYRVTKDGGVVVWVVNDATIDGSETGTSFRQVLYFKDECGFRLHDTMIYEKSGISFPSRNRYHNSFEYMFVLSKGRPNTFNPITKLNPLGGQKMTPTERGKNGQLRKGNGYGKIRPDVSIIRNIWRFTTNNTSTGYKLSYEHPAIFPDQLATDHIISWSNEGDLVLDPMCGSGTTCYAAKIIDRNYIGIDLSEKYCQIAEDRLKQQTISTYKT